MIRLKKKPFGRNSNGFIADLEHLSKNHHKDSNKKQQQNPWILVLIDGDNIETGALLLSQDKEEKEALLNNFNNHNNEAPSIKQDIISIDSYLSKIDKRYSYYLGDRLFALFINGSMQVAVETVEKLIKNLKDSIHFELSIGMASCKQPETKHETKKEINNINEKNKTNKSQSKSQSKSKSSPKQFILTFKDAVLNKRSNKKNEFQRQWVYRAHMNMLRAKEAGGNCYFNDEVCLCVSIVA